MYFVLIFSHYRIDSSIFGEKNIGGKICGLVLSKTFLVLRRIQQDIIINLYRYLRKVPVIFVRFRGEFRPRQTRQLSRAVDLNGRLLSCQSY